MTFFILTRLFLFFSFRDLQRRHDLKLTNTLVYAQQEQYISSLTGHFDLPSTRLPEIRIRNIGMTACLTL